MTRASVIGIHWYVVPGLGISGFTDATMRPTVPRVRAAPSMTVAHLEGQVANGDQVLVGLGREADHVVELQVLEAGAGR